jgi:hypothetical protein
MLQPAVLDREGELAQPRVVGTELEARAWLVAVHLHRVDPPDPLARQPLPRATVFEERSGPRAQGVDAAVPGGFGRRRRGRLRLDERQRQPAAVKRACKGEPDEPAADDDDVE